MKYLKETPENIVENLFVELNTTADGLAEQIGAEIKKIFPNSYAYAYFRGNLGGSINISFAIGKDKSEWSNGYIENDPVFHTFMIYDGVSTDGELSDKMVLERSKGNIHINPAKDSYMAMETYKVSYRKVTGDEKKILEGVKKYFTKLKSELKKVESNIYNYNLKGKF